MAITKLENDALSNTVTANVVSMSFGNSSVNTVVTSSGITLSNTVTTQAFAVPLVAGEALTALDAVYVESSVTGGTAGRVYRMDATTLGKSTQAFFTGFALAAATAGANVNIQTSGVVSGFTGLTSGALYYANTSPGAITATKQTNTPFIVGVAVSSTSLYVNTGRVSTIGNSKFATYGYVLGTGGYSANGQRILFSTGVFASSTASNLSDGRYGMAGLSDTTTYGYASGGANSTVTGVTTTDRTTFSSGTTAARTATNLGTGRYYPSGLSDKSNFGYVIGGYRNDTGYQNLTDRITFGSSTAAAATASNLVGVAYGKATISDTIQYGYATGGNADTGFTAAAERITFSSGVFASYTAANLSQARGYIVAGLSDQRIFGYALGGDTGAVTGVVTVDRITFSTGTMAAQTAANLTAGKYGKASVSDGVVYGYCSGGSNPGTTTTDRVTYSTSTTAAYTTGNLLYNTTYTANFSDGAV